MEESKNKQLELVDTLTPLPQSESEPREFSYFLEEKEPGNEGTSSSVVKQERVVSDHATSSVDQSMYYTYHNNYIHHIRFFFFKWQNQNDNSWIS